MYDFIRIMYVMGRITKEEVRAMSPKHITAVQAEKIISGIEV